jgi:hypothetical protein
MGSYPILKSDLLCLIKSKKPKKVMRALKELSVGWDEKKYLGF